ncbi:MAG: hypothetical protein IJW94_00960 [Oscillospiraceae bacterium]|nr:hypothetical protein [Oscillospiraceae bacterium]
MAKRNRYKEMEKRMTAALIGDAALFLIYLIAAGAAVLWLKIVTAIFALLLSIAALAFLYLSKELLKQRSLWLSSGFFSIFMCVLASLILSFP